MKVLKTFLFALNFLAVKSYFLTDLFDIYQFDEKCVVQFLNTHTLNVTRENHNRCDHDIRTLKRSVSQTIEEILEGHEKINVECAINLLEFYNISSVVLKALAYHQKLVEITTNAQLSCKDVIKFNSTLSVTECGEKVLTVESIGVSKSFTHLRHCFNDLFFEFQPDKIAFNEKQESEIYPRYFGKHLMEFLMQVSMIGLKYCEKSENVEINSNNFTGIDIFGLTQPSIKIEKCIIEEIKHENHLNFLHKFSLNSFDEIFSVNHKRLIEITLICLKEF